MIELDHGIRCERHIGEAFPPRCAACDAEAAAEEHRRAEARRVGDCPAHPGYPVSERFPCARCEREGNAS